MFDRFSRRKAGPVSTVDPDAYSAVSICCESGACEAATALLGKRILDSEAPDLPLPACTAETCHCHYIAYRDRRNFLTNRRKNVQLEAAARHNPLRRERRKQPDRRKLHLNGGREQ